jgi:FkbM family methyltransferase
MMKDSSGVTVVFARQHLAMLHGQDWQDRQMIEYYRFAITGKRPMQPSQSRFVGFFKKLLFRSSAKNPRLQRLWGMLQTLSLFGMNYGGGGLIDESGETWVLANIVSPACKEIAAPIIFDVGANVGDYSAMLLSHLPSATIYAFEPSPAVYRELVEHTARNGAGAQIRPQNFGFSDSERTVDFYSYTVEGEQQSLLSSIDLRLPTQALDVRAHSSEQIRVRTIDEFCRAEGIARIDFLKLDVEGHEMSVLRGAQNMLEAGAITMIQFEFGPANIYSRTFFYDFWSMLTAQYNLFRVIPKGLAPITYYGEHREVFLTTNYLAMRKQGT